MQIKSDISQPKAILTLSIISSLLAALSIFIGDICAPFAAAFYAMLILTESSSRRIFAYAIPAISILADVLLNGFAGYGSIQFTVMGIVIAIAFTKKFKKSTLAAILSAIFIIFILWGLCCSAFRETGVYTLESAKEFYFTLLEKVKTEMVDILTKVPISATQSGEGVYLTVADASAIVSSVFGLLISFVAVIAFLLSGITIKVFYALAARYSADEDEVRAQMFITSSVFAYAYLAVFVLNFLSAGMGEIASAVIANLYVILMFVYAYVGAKLALGFILHSQRRSLFTMIAIFALITMSFYALVPLSLFGTYGVIVTNRHLSSGENGENH